MELKLERFPCELKPGAGRITKGMGWFSKMERRASDRIGYLVLHHSDFDGYLTACLFNLRATPILDLPPTKIIYAATTYGHSIDVKKMKASCCKTLECDDVRIICLDLMVPQSVVEQSLPYMIIDHHAGTPFAERVIHDSDQHSCAELVAKSFPIVSELEIKDKVDRALYSARHIDTGGNLCSKEEMYRILTERPGCLSMHIERMAHSTALKMLCGYLKGSNNPAEELYFYKFSQQNKKLLQYEPEPRRVLPIKGRDRDYDLAWYHFGSSKLEDLRYKITQLKSCFSHDFVLMTRDACFKMDSVKASFRTKMIDFDVNTFCRLFGGGGRSTNAGGFLIPSSVDLPEYISIIAEALSGAVTGATTGEIR
jgi:hypothetical protein